RGLFHLCAVWKDVSASIHKRIPYRQSFEIIAFQDIERPSLYPLYPLAFLFDSRLLSSPSMYTYRQIVAVTLSPRLKKLTYQHPFLRLQPPNFQPQWLRHPAVTRFSLLFLRTHLLTLNTCSIHQLPPIKINWYCFGLQCFS